MCIDDETAKEQLMGLYFEAVPDIDTGKIVIAFPGHRISPPVGNTH